MDLDPILDKFNRKGWNAYLIEAHDQFFVPLRFLEIIRKKPASKLERGKHYLIAPRPRDPDNTQQIWRLANINYVSDLKPTIMLEDREVRFYRVKFKQRSVELLDLRSIPYGYDEQSGAPLFKIEQENEELEYEEFVPGLEKLNYSHATEDTFLEELDDIIADLSALPGKAAEELYYIFAKALADTVVFNVVLGVGRMCGEEAQVEPPSPGFDAASVEEKLAKDFYDTKVKVFKHGTLAGNWVFLNNIPDLDGTFMHDVEKSINAFANVDDLCGSLFGQIEHQLGPQRRELDKKLRHSLIENKEKMLDQMISSHLESEEFDDSDKLRKLGFLLDLKTLQDYDGANCPLTTREVFQNRIYDVASSFMNKEDLERLASIVRGTDDFSTAIFTKMLEKYECVFKGDFELAAKLRDELSELLSDKLD